MIMKYKPAYKKIAMGLLSYMPNLKDVKMLQETIQQYENDETMKLYLWKKEDDVVGVLGYQEQDGDLILRHVCVNPSYRDEGIGSTMVSTVEERQGKTLRGSSETLGFLQSCKRLNKENGM
ncbi:riboflavin biosynthesis RibT protein [Geomicrobium halophilum]|uniref:Riboflavin biosynthesis RibT protein n=1 Tax=Geomicrobium halophilum TaxID=549000 RepID=A0A841PRR6_9BACL|nr:GNAT family N-acetyltransferase [Geomicrobium halophilum]MBB6448981.1 riboflavin biosynthesis RibT protein [Geomicrobium halophilum]